MKLPLAPPTYISRLKQFRVRDLDGVKSPMERLSPKIQESAKLREMRC